MSQLSLFGGRRQRGRKPPPAKEIALHILIAQALDRWGSKGWRYTHIGHGPKLDIITAVKLKRMGVKKGWSDFILLSPRTFERTNGIARPGVAHFLEVKRERAQLSPEQKDFEQYCTLNGFPFAKVDNYKAAMTQLAAWGAIRVTISEVF